MKKSTLLSLALALIAPLFVVSCGKKTTGPKDTVVVWHWMTDRDDAFQELARRYKQETGKNVQFQLYAPSDVYSQKVRVGAQTDSLPDVFGVLGDARDLANFIDAGHVENLTPYFGEGAGSWKSRFYDEALNTTHYGPDNTFKIPEGYYGVPIDVTTIPMIYNKKLFAKAGLDPQKPPKTWDEFIADGIALKKAGVTGFVSGWAETWLIYSLVTDLAHNQMGAAKVMDTFAGKVKYTDPDWVAVLSAFEKLQKAGFSDPGLVTLGNKSAEQAFSQERSGMTFNGSWAVNVYSGMNPSLDYAPFAPPLLNPKFPQPVWGGAGTVFLVNAKSEMKQPAIDFLKWLSESKQASYLVSATKNLSAVKDATASNESPVLKQFADLMKNSIHPNRFTVSEDPKVQEVLTKGIQSILIAEKTPAQVAEETQKAKEKVQLQ
jgi:ABC-type glycerol-3-phosphate transport system substrate-binding protein